MFQYTSAKENTRGHHIMSYSWDEKVPYKLEGTQQTREEKKTTNSSTKWKLLTKNVSHNNSTVLVSNSRLIDAPWIIPADLLRIFHLVLAVYRLYMSSQRRRIREWFWTNWTLEWLFARVDALMRALSRRICERFWTNRTLEWLFIRVGALMCS